MPITHTVTQPPTPVGWEHTLTITMPKGEQHIISFWTKSETAMNGVKYSLVESDSMYNIGLHEFDEDEFLEIIEYLDTLTFDPDTGVITTV